MRKTVLLYGVAMAALIGVLKFIEYRYYVRDLSLEVYLGVVAALFTGLGVWVGLRLTRRKVVVVTPEVQPPDFQHPAFQRNDQELQRLGISKREYEVLELIAQGHSNQEIAEKLFVSLNTVKTHSSNLFMKLDARRRTQAVLRAKELGLLP
jgi:DNA-binding NarL/FixJ family response regulator